MAFQMAKMPDAKVIRMVRDPCAVLLARKEKWRIIGQTNKSIPFIELLRQVPLKNPLIATRIWRNYVRTGDQYRNDTRVLTVRFEDLVRQPSETIRSVCEFLGFDSNITDDMDSDLLTRPICLEGRTIGPSIRPEEAIRWREQKRLNSAEVFICQFIASCEMRDHGYERVKIIPNPLALLFYLARVPADLVLAVVVNMRRLRLITGFIKRQFGL